MEPPKIQRRNTMVEEAAYSLIETSERTEEINKSQKKDKKRLYNSEYREFLGRDAKSWFKLSIFFGIFYAALAGFFLLCLTIFYQTIDQKTPTYYNKDSVMNFHSVNPGLGFRPQLNPESELIALNTSSWKPIYNYLDLFLQSYENGKNINFTGAHGRSVNFNYTQVIDKSPCAKSKHYGMSSGTPCVVIKLNKIFGWFPRYSSENLPKTLSDIKSKNKFVFIACKGEYPADEENMGLVDYYSSYPNSEIGGINFKYFPYRNQPNYLSPLVFVHFKNVSKNVLVNVECKAYAKNIDNKDRINRRGMVKFQLFVTS